MSRANLKYVLATLNFNSLFAKIFSMMKNYYATASKKRNEHKNGNKPREKLLNGWKESLNRIAIIICAKKKYAELCTFTFFVTLLLQRACCIFKVSYRSRDTERLLF